MPRARYLVIVAQSHPELFARFSQLFDAYKEIEVLVDRRDRQRQPRNHQSRQSRIERRRQWRVEDQVRSLGAAVIPLPMNEAAAIGQGPTSQSEAVTGRGGDFVARRREVMLFRHPANRLKRYSVPVLIVAPLTLRPEIFDLAPGLSLVEHLTAVGVEVFLLDFGSPDPVRPPGFEEYLQQLRWAVDTALNISGAAAATLLGYCLGGLLALLYAALEPQSVRNLVILATPVDFSKAGPLYRFARRVDLRWLPLAAGNVRGDWIRDQIQLSVSCLMPELLFRWWLEIVAHGQDPAYWRRQALLVQWLNDLRPFSGVAYRQFIVDFVQANRLARRELRIGDRLIDLAWIQCPVLVAAHTEDAVAPPASALALLDLVASRDKESLSVSGGSNGHVDILIGPDALTVTWPKLTAWLIARST